MKIAALSSVLLLILVPLLRAQDPVSGHSYGGFAGLNHQQPTKRIFDGEREMIDGLRDSKPTLETYLQSLWTSTRTESPIDDAYFLSTVDFTRGYEDSGDGRRGYQTFLIGQSPASRKVRLNNGDRVSVYPDGYLDMMFVDLEDFDADTYDLTYFQTVTWDDRLCLIFSVTPRMSRSQGRFKGQIWVETSNFKIVRIRGTFTPVSIRHLRLRRFFGAGNIPLYFHFDSTRQEVTPGKWLPSYSYFDENRTWRQIDSDAATDLHYRGHVFIWGYNDAGDGADANQNQNSAALVRLENDKILARPGAVEDGLDSIVRRILTANNIGVSDIKCRVLLTTPIEILDDGHTIILSRGLLNILPNDSAIPILLAYEIADMLFGKPGVSSENEESVWQKSLVMVDKAGYSKGVGYTSLLFAQLVQQSKHIQNLLRARFGLSLLDIAKGLPTTAVAAGSPTSLVLRGKYTIDAWGASLQVRYEHTNSIATESIPPF